MLSQTESLQSFIETGNVILVTTLVTVLVNLEYEHILVQLFFSWTELC